MSLAQFDLSSLPPFNAEHDEEFTGTKNKERAERGFRLLLSYAKKAGFSSGDLNESYSHADPICDILHAAHERGLDVEQVLWSALNNFTAETK